VADNIREWLTGLGLEQHAEVFEAGEVALDAVPGLTDEALQTLGVADAGDREKIIAAAAASAPAPADSPPLEEKAPAAPSDPEPAAPEDQASPPPSDPPPPPPSDPLPPPSGSAKDKSIAKAKEVGSEVGQVLAALRAWTGKQAGSVKDKKRLMDLHQQLGQLVVDGGLVGEDELSAVRAAAQAISDRQADIARAEAAAQASQSAKEKMVATKDFAAAKVTLKKAELDLSSATRSVGASVAGRGLSNEAATPLQSELAAIDARATVASEESANLKAVLGNNKQGAAALAASLLLFFGLVFGVISSMDNGGGSGSSGVSSSSRGSSSSSSSSRWSCSDYDVETVSTYARTGEWPYGSGGLPQPSGSMANCMRSSWTFENCARRWGLGGDMYSCKDKVQAACCH
jgi:hypothetical protein